VAAAAELPDQLREQPALLTGCIEIFLWSLLDRNLKVIKAFSKTAGKSTEVFRIDDFTFYSVLLIYGIDLKFIA